MRISAAILSSWLCAAERIVLIGASLVWIPGSVSYISACNVSSHGVMRQGERIGSGSTVEKAIGMCVSASSFEQDRQSAFWVLFG